MWAAGRTGSGEEPRECSGAPRKSAGVQVKGWLLMLVNTVRRPLCSVHSAVTKVISLGTHSYSRFLDEEAEALSSYLVSTLTSL